MRKHLQSRWKLVTEKEKEQLTGKSEIYLIPWANIRWLKNITRKHLPSGQKPAREKNKNT